MWETLTALARTWHSQSAECRAELQHAMNVCTNMVPTTPGFPPFRAAWGWLLLGLVVGFFASVLLDHLRTRRSRSTPDPSWRDLILDKLAVVADHAEQEVLQYLADGGTRALEDMARSAGLTPMRLLAKLLSSHSTASQALRPASFAQQSPPALPQMPVPAAALAQLLAGQPLGMEMLPQQPALVMAAFQAQAAQQHAQALALQQQAENHLVRRRQVMEPVNVMYKRQFVPQPPPGLAPPPR